MQNVIGTVCLYPGQLSWNLTKGISISPQALTINDPRVLVDVIKNAQAAILWVPGSGNVTRRPNTGVSVSHSNLAGFENPQNARPGLMAPVLQM